MIKVRQKYAVSKVHVRLKNGKSTVKHGKSIVLYGNFLLAPTVCSFMLKKNGAPLLVGTINYCCYKVHGSCCAE